MAKQKNQMVQAAKAAPSNLVRGLMAPAAGRVEGHSIPMQMISEGPTGATAKFGLDITSAPVPQRRYAAELCSVQYVSNEVRFTFGQHGLGGGPLESALVIRMNPIAAKGFADSIAELANPSIDEIAAGLDLVEEPLGNIKERPNQVANMIANFVGVAVAGHETCLDFYHASAFAMRNAVNRHTMEVEPVVRVDLRTSLFISAAAKLREIVDAFPLRANEGENHV